LLLKRHKQNLIELQLRKQQPRLKLRLRRQNVLDLNKRPQLKQKLTE
jgi:hypothetical protein